MNSGARPSLLRLVSASVTLPLVGLLKDYRAAAGLTQGELAERARLSVRAISDLERGVRRAPHKDTLLLLAEALGLDEEKRDLLLEAARRSRRMGLPATTALLHTRPLPSDYPNALTPLIGRERDEASVAHLLTQASVRLLTLTGPAGIGKTRLAMQVAANLRDRFADGVMFISLAAISNPHLVLRAVAQEFGLRELVNQPMEEQLQNFLAERETLIVLDNFEQVARAGPDVARFVAACPGVKALVTSRAALRIRGEHEFAVPPLDTPDLACLPVVEDLTQYAAVALFMQRARAQGNPVQAGKLYRQGLHIRRIIARRLANDAVHIDAIWHALECLGGVALDQGLPLQAARLFGAASRLHDMIGVPRFEDVHRIHECDVERTEQALGDERFATAWGEGRAMSLEEAVALATDDYMPDDIDA